LSQQIEGCAYNPEHKKAVFRKDNMVVLVYPKEIGIFHIEDEVAAMSVLVWLRKMIENIHITP
jgi:hypothetical protein